MLKKADKIKIAELFKLRGLNKVFAKDSILGIFTELFKKGYAKGCAHGAHAHGHCVSCGCCPFHNEISFL